MYMDNCLQNKDLLLFIITMNTDIAILPTTTYLNLYLLSVSQKVMYGCLGPNHERRPGLVKNGLRT